MDTATEEGADSKYSFLCLNFIFSASESSLKTVSNILDAKVYQVKIKSNTKARGF